MDMRHVVSFNKALKQLRGTWRSALDALWLADAAGLKLTEVSSNTAIHACGRANAWLQAFLLFRWMQEISMKSSSVTRSSLTSALGSLRKLWGEALELLRASELCTVRPNIVCYNSSLAVSGSWKRALASLKRMAELYMTDLTSWNTAMKMLALDEWQRALVMFFKMPFLSLERDVVSYGTAFSASKKHWPAALELLKEGLGWFRHVLGFDMLRRYEEIEIELDGRQVKRAKCLIFSPHLCVGLLLALHPPPSPPSPLTGTCACLHTVLVALPLCFAVRTWCHVTSGVSCPVVSCHVALRCYTVSYCVMSHHVIS